MVKTRRSGENGDIEDGNEAHNDRGSISDDKPISSWSKRELRSSQYSVSRKIQRWPTKYRRISSMKMPRLVFPESDTEPEKYSRRSRKVRVFFTGDTESTNRSVRIRRSRGPRKNYMEESEDKPIQQNVRRSCRKRKLLHHSFNESWITNELKVRGYPDLYGLQGSSSSDEFSSGDEARPQESRKRLTRTSNGPSHTDEDINPARQTRNSSRFSTKKNNGGTETESEEDNNQTVIEMKSSDNVTKDKEQMNVDEQQNEEPDVKKEDVNHIVQDSESNQGPSRPLRRTRARQTKKEDIQLTASDSDTSDFGSDIMPRRSNRTRKPKQAFVELTPRPTRERAKTFTIRKKPYSLRERKPKILRRKTIRSQSPSSSSSSSSDTEEDLNVSVKNKSKGRQKSNQRKKSMGEKTTERALRDIQPVELDGSIRFSSVGGLDEHIKCLREMVIFPLMYPDYFKKFHTQPAKGVLFHGPPGTGKTLLARALANECSLVGGRKVSFFMRKGADCLKKWVGESERHLKLLFQQANKMKPSIIFFDEIDALAPVRSVRQDQVHTSVVGTLLVEMDGLCDRGDVVVIGATNRPDAVEPALRRAGRFDRELLFAPPDAAARQHVLRIHTALWRPPPAAADLAHVARLAHGYGGADLKALCSEAVLKALRRVYPQVYDSEHALVIDPSKVEVSRADLEAAMRSVVAAGCRLGAPPARPLSAALSSLLGAQLASARLLLRCPPPPPPHCERLLLSGPAAACVLAPALLAALERRGVRELSVAALHACPAGVEQAVLGEFAELRRAGGVLVLREAEALWAALGAAAALLLQLLAAAPPPLLLATSSLAPADLPQPLQELFPPYKQCTYIIREPTTAEVINFLSPVMTQEPLVPPPVEDSEPPPPLPRAPAPPPPPPSPAELQRRKRQEDYKLRELRIFLRDICRKLASNRRFYKFTKPVDLDEVTDYLDIVQQPMDLETMMTKVDMHKYNCAKEFLDDVDLICANALEYNPDRTSSDKQIRHEACSLRDHAHALIEVEMDSDFEVECQQIATRRRQEGAADEDLPDFIYTASNLRTAEGVLSSGGVLPIEKSTIETPVSTEKGEGSARRKRRRMNAWSKGLVAKRSRTQKTYKEQAVIVTDEESKENKPIVTSTPLSNGASASASASSNDDALSDDDTPLHSHTHTDTILQLVDSGPKSSERTEKTKTTPKKRNSGHEIVNGDTDKVIINKTELDNILYKNAKSLRTIGLEALIDLQSQLSIVVNSYSKTLDRTKLPSEIQSIVSRYIQHLAKK